MVTIAAAQNPAGGIVTLGTFCNSRHAEDHTDGYTVQLWRQGDRVFGFLSVEALSGDGPIGSLYNVKFEERVGKLSFEAKLTTGMRLLADNSQQPSRDVFRFRGVLVKDTLAGNLTHSDLLDPASGETPIRIRLQKQAPEAMTEPKTYAEWKTAAEEILKLRGPKWQ
jgi:hypothetical protein